MDRKRIVQEYLEYLSIFQSQKEAFTFRWTADDFDVPDQGFHYPLSFFSPFKIEALQPLLLAKDKMVGADDKQVAVDFLVDLLLDAVVHVRRIARVQLIDDNPFWELDGQPVFVNGDLLDQIPTFDPDFLIREQVLDDHVGHVLPVGIALPVEAMDGAEYQLIVSNGSILATNSNEARVRSCCTAPDP